MSVAPALLNQLRIQQLVYRDQNHAILLCASLFLFGAALRAGEPPIISAIPDQVTFEDLPILRVPFTVWDADTPLDQLRFSSGIQFASGGLRIDNIDFGGT